MNLQTPAKNQISDSDKLLFSLSLWTRENAEDDVFLFFDDELTEI